MLQTFTEKTPLPALQRDITDNNTEVINVQEMCDACNGKKKR